MTRLTCTEFDAFEEALYGVQGRYVLRTRQQRDWRLRIVDLDGIALMAGREGAGTVYNGIGLPGTFNLFVPLSAHEFTVVDGVRFDRRKIGWMAPNVMFHIDAGRPGSWLTVAMSCEIVLDWARTHADEFDFSLLSRNLVRHASTGLLPLIRLAYRLFQIDAKSPEDIRTIAAQRVARAEVMETVFGVLWPVGSGEPSQRRGLDRRRVLERALELLDSPQSMAVCIQDLSAAACASERTVRNVFNDYLGMSPHRYLMLRRLHTIRSALHRSGPGDSVTNICAKFGVWDIGRFAKQYRERFGELPSESLSAKRRESAVFT
jgi:AraC family transcriptional regulator, ethanolamine operon transcriptional activator